MLKRIVPMLLVLITVVTLLPARAEATVLSGWTSKVDYENTDPYRYAIEIDVVNQVITVYERTIGGAVVLQSLCTTGSKENPTGTGTFKLGNLKERFGYFVAYGQYAQYWTQVTRGIYIHSIMYSSQKLTKMSKSAYKNLGKNVSHGCVRVLPEVAKWIFYNCPPGTVCKVAKKAKDAELVKAIKKNIPAYDKYVQPEDTKAWPQEIPAVVRYDNTPIRTGSSSTNDKTFGYLKAGTRAMLLQIAPDWCKLKTEQGDIGYVKSQYILAYPDSAVQTASAYAASGKTYVYAAASTKAKTLYRIKSGARMTLISRVNDSWWYGVCGGVEGYIRNKYVKTVTDYVYPELPVAEQTAPYTQGSQSSGGGGIFGSSQGASPATPYATPAPTDGSSGRSGIFGSSGSSSTPYIAPTPTPTPRSNGIFG